MKKLIFIFLLSFFYVQTYQNIAQLFNTIMQLLSTNNTLQLAHLCNTCEEQETSPFTQQQKETVLRRVMQKDNPELLIPLFRNGFIEPDSISPEIINSAHTCPKVHADLLERKKLWEKK